MQHILYTLLHHSSKGHSHIVRVTMGRKNGLDLGAPWCLPCQTPTHAFHFEPLRSHTAFNSRHAWRGGLGIPMLHKPP